MADSVSTEAWLDQRRWAALEEALKAQGSNVKRHLQDYLITLYNETVPLERWVQIETAITKEELESAQAAEDQKVYAAFHIRENGHDSIFSTGNGEEFLDVAIRLRRYLQGGAESVKGDFSHHFYKAQPITRERFDELATLRMENIGKVSGALWMAGILLRSRMSQLPFITPRAVYMCHWNTSGTSLSTTWMENKSSRRALPLLRLGAYVPWRREIYSVLTDLFPQTGS